MGWNEALLSGRGDKTLKAGSPSLVKYSYIHEFRLWGQISEKCIFLGWILEKCSLLSKCKGFPKKLYSPEVHFQRSAKGTPHEKKMFSFGHCPNEGGGRALPELKNTLYIFLYDGRKRCTSCPKENILFYMRCSLSQIQYLLWGKSCSRRCFALSSLTGAWLTGWHFSVSGTKSKTNADTSMDIFLHTKNAGKETSLSFFYFHNFWFHFYFLLSGHSLQVDWLADTLLARCLRLSTWVKTNRQGWEIRQVYL